MLNGLGSSVRLKGILLTEAVLFTVLGGNAVVLQTFMLTGICQCPI